jgi:hypothetical protein
MQLDSLFKETGLKQFASRLGRLKPERLNRAGEGGETSVLDEEAVRNEIQNFGGIGWICFADKVVLFEQKLSQLPNDYGPILSAEFYRTGDNISLHVRQEPGGWSAVQISTEGCSENNPASWIISQNFLRFDSDAKTGSLRWMSYEVGWELSDEQPPVLRPSISRFVGFEPPQE